MPNLVGIGNSQVPTNAMLGGLAYQDSVGEINLEKIKARTSESPVDIFVYDTSKDSDGGAWRKKATKQSWYNEELGTNVRGSRREFPAVAVIVVEGGKVVIFDGDDPNLPLWMEFNVAIPKILYTNTTCAHMLNGVLVVGTNPNSTTNDYWDGGIKVFNFISDKIRSYSGTRSMVYTMNISERNETRTNYYDTTNVLVSPNVSAVTMFVLPNATIDVDTGLPTPTILAATRRGISAVRDNGVVYDMLVTVGGGSNYQTNSIEITKDLKIIHNWDDRASNAYSYISIIPLSLLESDSSYGYEYQFRNEGTYTYNVGNGSLDIFNEVATYFVDAVPTELGYFAIGSNRGLVIIQHIAQALTDGGRSSLGDGRFNGGMHCRITNNFNTGWMHGNIRGAFLSDTDTTNITGTSLIANGDFSSNSTAAFTTVAGGTAAVVGGLLKLTDTEGAFCYASAPFTTVPGNQYFVTADIVNNSNTANANYIRCGNSHNGIVFHNTNYGTSYGTKTFYFTATATTTYLTLISGNGVGEIGHWDNVFVYKLDNDRSVRKKGLRPHGTITKTAVDTNAELVAYSGFTSGNFLEMPDGEIGSSTSVNGPLTVSCWFKGTATSGASQSLVMIGPAAQHQARGILLDPSGNLGWFRWNNDPYSSRSVTDNQWHHCVGTLDSSSTVKLYVDGELVYNQSITLVTSGSNVVRIGYSTGNNAPLTNGSLSLVKISNSVASASQIKKVYDDEKCFYYENAKCTLHGTSDDIKAIDYDESNNVIHVGTSAGRSEFQGLNRINNTTTAVTHAISVSNEFVAER